MQPPDGLDRDTRAPAAIGINAKRGRSGPMASRTALTRQCRPPAQFRPLPSALSGPCFIAHAANSAALSGSAPEMDILIGTRSRTAPPSSR